MGNRPRSLRAPPCALSPRLGRWPRRSAACGVGAPVLIPPWSGAPRSAKFTASGAIRRLLRQGLQPWRRRPPGSRVRLLNTLLWCGQGDGSELGGRQMPDDAGSIIFDDPRGPLPPFDNKLTIRPLAGDLVLFPSWLMHQVRPPSPPAACPCSACQLGAHTLDRSGVLPSPWTEGTWRHGAGRAHPRERRAYLCGL